MRPYVLTSANTPEAIESAVIYGQIVCIGSIGAISGRKLDEGPSVAGQYAPSDGRPQTVGGR